MDVKIYADESIEQELIDEIVASERVIWANDYPNRTLGSIVLTVENDEIVLTASERSPIKRTARITGYLSNIDNFNSAKKDELKRRYKHVG